MLCNAFYCFALQYLSVYVILCLWRCNIWLKSKSKTMLK
nr:MAG TPA: hypothetical protein [Caudoviricetes sp.]